MATQKLICGRGSLFLNQVTLLRQVVTLLQQARAILFRLVEEEVSLSDSLGQTWQEGSLWRMEIEITSLDFDGYKKGLERQYIGKEVEVVACQNLLVQRRLRKKGIHSAFSSSSVGLFETEWCLLANSTANWYMRACRC